MWVFGSTPLEPLLANKFRGLPPAATSYQVVNYKDYKNKTVLSIDSEETPEHRSGECRYALHDIGSKERDLNPPRDVGACHTIGSCELSDACADQW